MCARSPPQDKLHDGLTPMHCAAQGGSVPVLTRLLQDGASLDAQDSEGCLPLHHAHG